MKLIKSIKNRLCYKCTDTGMLTPAAVSKIKWPSDKKYLFFEPRRGVMRMKAPLKLGVPWQKYNASLIFKQDRDKLLVPPRPAGHKDITVRTMRSKKELIKVYTSTQDMYHTGGWKKYFSETQKKESVMFRKKFLPTRVKGGIALKGRKPVGIIANCKLYSKIINKYVSFIVWAWIDPSLRGESRDAVRSGLVKWVKENSGRILCSHVSTYNLRSQQFCLGLGFRPIRAFVYRN